MACADHDIPFAGVVQRVDGDLLEIDVLPHVKFGPVREWKGADGLLRADPSVVETPDLGALGLGLPLTEFVSEGEEALLRARLLLVSPRAANGRVEIVGPEPGQQRLGLEEAAALLGAEVEGVRALRDRRLVPPDDELHAALPRDQIPERIHLLELVSRVYVHEGERDLPGVKRLLRQPQEHGGVLADRVEEDRALELRHDLAQHVDALGLQMTDVTQRVLALLDRHKAKVSHRRCIWVKTLSGAIG